MKVFSGAKDIVLFFADRLSESGTWGSIAALLVAAHVSVSGDTWHLITLIGVGVAGTVGIVLKEKDGTSAAQMVQDAMGTAVPVLQQVLTTLQTQQRVPAAAAPAPVTAAPAPAQGV